MQTSIKIDETNEKSMEIFDVALKTRLFSSPCEEKVFKGSISMRLTRGATYVVGGRVGMDETHQVN